MSNVKQLAADLGISIGAAQAFEQLTSDHAHLPAGPAKRERIRDVAYRHIPEFYEEVVPLFALPGERVQSPPLFVD